MASGGVDTGPSVGFNQNQVTINIGPVNSHYAILALDIGGSLAKVAYIPESRKSKKSQETTIHLVTFDTENTTGLLDFLKTDVIGHRNSHRLQVYGTGVGCIKYKQKIEDTLDVELINDCEEMKHALNGLDFLWSHLRPEALLYPESDITGLEFETSVFSSGLKPWMISNIGSALSVVKVDEKGAVEYIGGGITAGLTFLGLGALLTGSSNFTELQDLAERGDRASIDLFVKDTAGSGYSFAPPDSMVSSFGRVAKQHTNNPAKTFRPEDLACSLLYNMLDQLASTTYLVGKAHGIRSTVFCGSFLANSVTSRQQVKHKLQQCSNFLQHEIKPVFVRYEHYLGAIGALVSHLKNLDSSHTNS